MDQEYDVKHWDFIPQSVASQQAAQLLLLDSHDAHSLTTNFTHSFVSSMTSRETDANGKVLLSTDASVLEPIGPGYIVGKGTGASNQEFEFRTDFAMPLFGASNFDTTVNKAGAHLDHKLATKWTGAPLETLETAVTDAQGATIGRVRSFASSGFVNSDVQRYQDGKWNDVGKVTSMIGVPLLGPISIYSEVSSRVAEKTSKPESK